MYSLHLERPFLSIIFLLLAVIVWFAKSFFKEPRYVYTLTRTMSHLLKKNKFLTHLPLVLRTIIILLFTFLIGSPEIVQYEGHEQILGIDIMLVLDVSGSMSILDNKTEQSRFDIARQEAINFSVGRSYDSIGLVLFGKDVIFRCPLTQDKNTLVSILQSVKLGEVDSNGTVLFSGIAQALNRLRKSTSKSKIIILLTDGEPSPEDINPQPVIEIAKKMGVKIYTIGIGSQQFMTCIVNGMGVVIPPINEKLLQQVAQETNGKCFIVKDAHNLQDIYKTIDQLEKTERPVNRYHSLFHLIQFIGPLLLTLLFVLLFMHIFWFVL